MMRVHYTDHGTEKTLDTDSILDFPTTPAVIYAVEDLGYFEDRAKA